MADIESLNKQLPPGIKAVPTVNGIRYTVRTSIRGKKHSLGTFINYDAAVRALVEFKIKKSYTTAVDNVADIVTSTLAQQQAKVETQIVDAQKQTPIAEDVAMLREYIDMNGSHLLGSGNEAIQIALEDGTIKYISAPVVAIIYQEIWGMPPSGAIAKIVEL